MNSDTGGNKLSNANIHSHLSEQSYESLFNDPVLRDLRYISNYVNYIKRFHDKDVSETLPVEVRELLAKVESEYRAKYDDE